MRRFVLLLCLAIAPAAVAKNLIKPGSPSKVFTELASTIPAGMEKGIKGGAGRVADATDSMVAIPQASAPRGGGGGRNVQFTANITVNAAGGNGEDIADQVRAVVEDEFEKFAAQLGAEAA